MGADFGGRQGALQSFAKLEFHAAFFWQNSNPSILIKSRFEGAIAPNVYIFMGDIFGTVNDLIVVKSARNSSCNSILLTALEFSTSLEGNNSPEDSACQPVPPFA